ncbi:OmpA family protein [Escherichia coli]|nr:OmpA family protein [Escherichia coli]
MNSVQQRVLLLWASLLGAVVCLVFLPVSRPISLSLMLVMIGGVVVFWCVVSRRAGGKDTQCPDGLPDEEYRQPVVLVCGDLPPGWSVSSQVLTVTQGCWIRVEDVQSLEQMARRVLSLRPDWGRQLAVMVCICPQKHAERDVMTDRLLAIRWQINLLRKATGYSVPLILSARVGCAMTDDMVWQAAVPGEGVRTWRESSVPCSVAMWVTTGGGLTVKPLVLMNSLKDWLYRYVTPVFMDKNPDIPALLPSAVLWGIGPALTGCPDASLWTTWLSHHTGLQRVTGWRPSETDNAVYSLLPDFILSLLPEGQGLTSWRRTGHCAFSIFILAIIAMLLSSAWNNRQLLHRVSFDIARYHRLATEKNGAEAEAVAALQQDVVQLDKWERDGVPLRLSLGLYKGERLRPVLLDTIRSYVPPPPEPQPKSEPLPEFVPQIIRLDSLALFDAGKWTLKPGATKWLVNALVDIKAKAGWLIVVSGHTDNTGDPQRNQALSLKRAEAVRDWMRDTGDIPQSCFAVQGYGESRPVAPNDTAEGRARNRRVEISLVPQADACRLPDASPAPEEGASENITE